MKNTEKVRSRKLYNQSFLGGLILLTLCLMVNIVSAEVTLISPENNSISLINPIDFFVSVNSTSGENITNVSLCSDVTGSWGCDITFENEIETLYNPDSFINPNYSFDFINNTYSQKDITLSTSNALGQLFNNRYSEYIDYNFSLTKGGSSTGGLFTVLLQSFNGSEWKNEDTLVSFETPFVGFSETFYSGSYLINKSIQGIRLNFTNHGSTVTSKVYTLNYIPISPNNYLKLLFNKRINSSTLWNSRACYTNDSCEYASSNYTILDFLESGREHNLTTYETDSETFNINTTNSSSLTAVSLNYSGTLYSMSKVSPGYWSRTLDIPTSKVGNNSIGFQFTYAGQIYNSTYTTYQNVSSINLTECSAGTKFINLTFKDESTLSYMNASIQSSTGEYYLGSGTEKKTYLFSNSTEVLSRAFCFTPVTETIKVEPEITYTSTGYPQRVYQPSILTLTNSTTNHILYLLGQTDGNYVTFITATLSNVVIPGASIIVEREILGTTTTIAEGTTDSAGSFTAFLNPNYDHTIYASKENYGTLTEIIKPTQSSYTLTLSSGTNYTYISNVEGLLWAYYPIGGILNPDSEHTFGFEVHSDLDNLVGCKIELLNPNKTLIYSSQEGITTNNSYCNVSVSFLMNQSTPQIKGRLLVDIGDGYQILEEDAFWGLLLVESTGMTFMDWMENLKEFELRYFGGDTEEVQIQRREYTQILIFFLIVTLICAVLNISGWDIQTNGGMIFLVGFIIIIASFTGFLTLTYISPFAFIDKYFIAIVYIFFMIGYMTRRIS